MQMLVVNNGVTDNDCMTAAQQVRRYQPQQFEQPLPLKFIVCQKNQNVPRTSADIAFCIIMNEVFGGADNQRRDSNIDDETQKRSLTFRKPSWHFIAHGHTQNL
jgi:hypothetical protein